MMTENGLNRCISTINKHYNYVELDILIICVQDNCTLPVFFYRRRDSQPDGRTLMTAFTLTLMRVKKKKEEVAHKNVTDV